MFWNVLSILIGLALICLVLWEAFETILLPRTVNRTLRFTRVFFRSMWSPWVACSQRLRSASTREHFLGLFAPLSILILIGSWAVCLIVGFGLVQWGLAPDNRSWPAWATSVYLSGTTFFTLGLGDVKPESPLARLVVMIEGGLGFGFLASIIGYLPVIYAAFSRREISILRLDIRAGSPPTAGEFLRQHAHRGDVRDLDQFLRDFELWSAEVLESHLSYPLLCFYRSQHHKQSWLATTTAILDTCALLIVGIEGLQSRQAPITFVMARRALIDVADLFHLDTASASPPAEDRLPDRELLRLRELLREHAGLLVGSQAESTMQRLRATYEPTAHRLAYYLKMPLPPWMPAADVAHEPSSAAEKLFEEQGATDVSTV